MPSARGRKMDIDQELLMKIYRLAMDDARVHGQGIIKITFKDNKFYIQCVDPKAVITNMPNEKSFNWN